VWVANLTASTVTRIDPASHSSSPAIPVPAGPESIAAGDGGVWVASASGKVQRIDPATRRVTDPPVAIADPGGIAVGDGGVWVTSRSRDSVIRLDPRTGALVGQVIHVGAQPTDIATGASGVWVANSADGTVTHIDPVSGQPDPPIRVARHHPLLTGAGNLAHEQPAAEVLALAVDDSGVWVAKTDSPQTAHIEVVRIDPTSRTVTGHPIAVDGGIPMRIAAGNGSVWVTDVGSLLPGAAARPAALQRINARAGQRTGPPLKLGGEPTGLATGPRTVWVTNAGDNTATEVTAP